MPNATTRCFWCSTPGPKDVTVRLAHTAQGQHWTHRIATTTAWFGKEPLLATLDVPGPSVAVCGLDPHDD
jgi:hypothetical protein